MHANVEKGSGSMEFACAVAARRAVLTVSDERALELDTLFGFSQEVHTRRAAKVKERDGVQRQRREVELHRK